MIDSPIQNAYNNVKELLEQKPWHEEALNSLVKLEEEVDKRIFDILQNHYWNEWKKSSEYVKFVNDIEHKIKLENWILKKHLWIDITLSQLLDNFINTVSSILKEDIDVGDKLDKLKIEHIQLDWVILPPDKNIEIKKWSWKWFEKKEWYDRLSLLINKVLIPNWVLLSDILVSTWVLEKNMMREQSYVCVHIPKINKTIFVNNAFWEATFICDWIMEIHDFVTYWKNWLSKILYKIDFVNRDENLWINKVSKSLFTSVKDNNKWKGSIKRDILKDSLLLKERIRNSIINIKDEWFNLWYNSRHSFKLDIDGKEYTFGQICSLFLSCAGKEKLNTSEHYLELTKLIFWECDEYYQLKQRLYFNNYSFDEKKEYVIGEIKKIPDIWFWLNNTIKRDDFKFSEYNISYLILARSFWIKTKDNHYILSDWLFLYFSFIIFWENDNNFRKYCEWFSNIKWEEWINNIINKIKIINNENYSNIIDKYNKVIENEAKDRVKEYIFNMGDDWFWWFTERSCFSYQYNDKYIISYPALFNIFSVKLDSDEWTYSEKAFYKLTCAIFWEKHPKVIELKDKLLYVLSNNEQKQKLLLKCFKDIWVKHKWLSTKASDFETLGIDINWRKVWYLAILAIFWITYDKKSRYSYDNFFKLMDIVYWEDDDAIVRAKMNKLWFWIREALKKEIIPRKEEWLKLRTVDRQKFSVIINWLSINYLAIARAFWCNYPKSQVYKFSSHLELSKELFWNDDSDVKDMESWLWFDFLEKWRKQKLIREVMFREDEMNIWFNLIVKWREKYTVELNNWVIVWYKKLCSIFEIVCDKKDIAKDMCFLALSEVIYWEHFPRVKQLREKFTKKAKKPSN